MVKIPLLELGGQNWKIYRMKLLEHAAAKGWLNVLAGKPDEDWEGCNALLHELLHDTIPISIYIRLRRNTAHQAFKHLAKRFRDREPIADPRAKKLATCANEAKRHLSAEAPTSENAATERHAHAEREDLPCTKDLTRGTSAESANGTTVLLTGEPHETQNEPQDSLPLTPRLPTEGKPDECKQEAAESVVTAGRTNGTVGMTEPHEMDADIDRTAMLGREPAKVACGVDEGTETVADVDRTASLGGELAERVCGVDEGDRDREYQSRIQQTIFYCKEDRQRDENANVPNAHGLPLEGEWTVYASGESTNPNGDANASNAVIERVYRPIESGETEDAMENESRGCRGGTGVDVCVDEADSSPGRGIEPADISNESKGLVTQSIEPESPNGGEIPRVRLRGTSPRAGDANGPGRGTDASKGLADVSRARADASNASNRAETDGMSCDEGAGTYLSVRDAKRVVHATDGVPSHADASTGHGDVPCVVTDAYITATATEIISSPRKRPKPPDLPSGPAKWTPDVPDGCRSHADTSSVHMDAYCIGNDTTTAVNAPENVSIPRNESKTQDSPIETAKRHPDEPNGRGSRADGSSARMHAYCVGNEMETAGNEAERVRTRRDGLRTRNSPSAIEIATAKLPSRWRKVSIGGGDVYVPCNAPVAAIETASRNFVFGRPESGDEAIAPIVEGERAGDGDGDGYGDDGDVGDVDGTTSGGDSDSIRVEAALLAGESQRVRYCRRTRTGNLPVSSRPPTDHTNRPYGLVRRRRRRGRLKIERINISQTKEVETTHLRRAHATQPPGNAPNQAYGIYRPRRQRGRIKIATINVSRTRNGRITHLGRAIAMRPFRRPKKQIRRFNKLTFEYRMLGEPRRRDDGDYG